MTHAERMSVMREVVAWLRDAPSVTYMGLSNNGVGLAPRTRPLSAREAADNLERQIELGTA